MGTTQGCCVLIWTNPGSSTLLQLYGFLSPILQITLFHKGWYTIKQKKKNQLGRARHARHRDVFSWTPTYTKISFGQPAKISIHHVWRYWMPSRGLAKSDGLKEWVKVIHTAGHLADDDGTVFSTSFDLQVSMYFHVFKKKMVNKKAKGDNKNKYQQQNLEYKKTPHFPSIFK